MAGRGLGSLTLDLIAKIGGFVGPLSQAERELDKRTRAMERRSQAFAKGINSAFGGMALKLGGFLGSFVAVNRAVDGFFASIDRADQMRDLSIQLGIGVENLSSLSYAAQQSGVDLDTLATSLKFLEKNAAAALDPKSRQRGLFDAILGKGNADLKDAEHLLSQLADAFSKMEEGPTRAALELELFGKSGLKMAEFLKQGSAEIERLRQRARELGVTIDEETASKADRFNDTLADVKAVAAGLGTQLATALMPQVEQLLDWMVKFGSDPGNVEKLVHDTTEAFNDLADAIGSVGKAGSQIYGHLDTLQAKLTALEQNGQKAAMALYMAMTPDGSWADKVLRENQGRLDILQGESALIARGHGPQRLRPLPSPKEGTDVDEAAQKRIAAFMAGNTDATNKNADAKRKAAEAAREQAERERELAEAVKKATEAQEEFDHQVEDLLAQQGGPLAESQLRFRREEEKLRELWEQGSTPSAEKLAQALDALHEARDKDAEAIRRELDPAGEHLKQMQDELDLLNLQTQAERDRAAFLQDFPTATEAQADAFARMREEMDRTRESISQMDELRGSLFDFVDAARQGEATFTDFADTVVEQLIRIAEQWLVTQLLGEPGTSGPNWLSGIFGALSGFGSAPVTASGGLGIPGFANGTDFAPGGWADVGEHGKERVYLPRGSRVVPNHELETAGAGAFYQTNNFPVLGRPDNRSLMQVAQANERAGRMASRRNGR